jgi:hypothetical protein
MNLGNDAFAASGLALEILEPFRRVRLTYDGKLCLLEEPHQMAEYRCDGKIGFGMSEYLDQIVDGRPIGGLD